jgi:polyhydroxybutyrate depolymerase
MKTVTLVLTTICPMLLLIGCAPVHPKQGFASPGTYQMQTDLVTGGFLRKSLVHIPQNYDPSKPWPLLIAIHGAFSNASEMEEKSDFSNLADREGFIVLYPEGIGIFGYLQHWNAGHCCGKAAKDGIDDIGFLNLLIDKAVQKFSADPKQIFMVGHSNGGMLAFRYAAEQGARLAGVAAVSAPINSAASDQKTFPTLPVPQAPLPVCIIHGVDDESVPFTGGTRPGESDGRKYTAAADAVAYWRKSNGCSDAVKERSWHGTRVKQSLWQNCTNDTSVVLYAIKKWGHAWPGPKVSAMLDQQEKQLDFDAAQVIWNFFMKTNQY